MMGRHSQRFIHDSKKQIYSIGTTIPLQENEYPSDLFIYPKSINNNEVITICIHENDYFVKGNENFVIFYESADTSIPWIQNVNSFYRQVEIDSY